MARAFGDSIPSFPHALEPSSEKLSDNHSETPAESAEHNQASESLVGAGFTFTQTKEGPDPAAIPTSIANEDSSATTLKRSDVLQGELSDYPTTITDRVLTELRAHEDNPVDRALADLLSDQLSGNNAHPQPQHSDSPDESQEQNQDHDHVHHSDTPDEEQP